MRVERTGAVFEKRLSSRERSEPDARARLIGEAQLFAALDGRVTPRLVGRGEDERGPWLQTEQLPFPTLAERMEKEHAIATAWIERAVRSAFAALVVLHEAHDEAGPLSIVHADISPANLAIDDAAARAVFLDLELASWRESSPRDGAFRGTVTTCAPEIARGETPTIASDLFALAATLVEAAIGAPLRDGSSLAALLPIAAEQSVVDVLVRDHADLASRGAGHAALLRCLAHAPADRPKDARAVLLLLA